MKIFVGSDHAGFELKKSLLASLPQYDWQDIGTHSLDSVDYPDFASLVCEKIQANNTANNIQHTQDALTSGVMGLLICGSGQGMAIRANKFSTVRAALCWNTEITHLSREHNNANILCLGSRFVNLEQAQEMVDVFFKTSFAGGRHSQRVSKISRDTNC